MQYIKFHVNRKTRETNESIYRILIQLLSLDMDVSFCDKIIKLLLLSLLLLSLLFAFNIYILAVAITVISPVRRVVTNDQRLTEYSLFTFPILFLVFLQFPTKTVFCITLTLHIMPRFPTHLSNSVETLPRAPIITGTISTFLNFHNLLISFFKSWYFSTLSFFFPLLLHQLVQQYQ